MKKLVLLMVIIAFSACAACTTQADMPKLKLDRKMVINGVEIKFTFSEDDEYLRVILKKQWKGDPEGNVHYEVNLFDRNKNLLGMVSVDTKKKNAGTVITYFKDVKKSNNDRAAFFSLKSAG
jgi:hypothetical protein